MTVVAGNVTSAESGLQSFLEILVGDSKKEFIFDDGAVQVNEGFMLLVEDDADVITVRVLTGKEVGELNFSIKKLAKMENLELPLSTWIIGKVIIFIEEDLT